MTTAGVSATSAAAGDDKKPRGAASKAKKAKSSSPNAHPTYFQMIKEAIVALKERSGSSPYAIAKYMEEHNKGVLPANFKKILATQLKNSAAKGKLIKVKASFKLSDSSKKEAVAAPKPKAEKAKKTVDKKPAAKKAVKKPAEKKAAVSGVKRKSSAVSSAAGDKKKVKKSVVAKSPKKVKKVKKVAPVKPKKLKSVKAHRKA